MVLYKRIFVVRESNNFEHNFLLQVFRLLFAAFSLFWISKSLFWSNITNTRYINVSTNSKLWLFTHRRVEFLLFGLPPGLCMLSCILFFIINYSDFTYCFIILELFNLNTVSVRRGFTILQHSGDINRKTGLRNSVIFLYYWKHII